MTEKSRLEEFKELVDLEPDDTFCRYALGMEYMGISEFDEAVRHFEAVIRLDPSYAAAYFQAGIASKKNRNISRAREFLVRGIEVAEKNGNRHARDEMRDALENLEGLE